jgi:hypothetical protein
LPIGKRYYHYINTAKRLKPIPGWRFLSLSKEIGWRSKMLKLNDSFFIHGTNSRLFQIEVFSRTIKQDPAKYFSNTSAHPFFQIRINIFG